MKKEQIQKIQKKNRAYWQKRARANKLKVINIGENQIKEFKRLLYTNLENVSKRIKAFYDKYGNNYTEQLTIPELRRYKYELRLANKKYPKDKVLKSMLKKDAPLYQIDRLRTLEADLQIQLAHITDKQAKGIKVTLEDVATYTNSVMVQQFTKGYGVAFNTLNQKALEKIINQNWIGKGNWSSKLWKDRVAVGRKLTQVLEKGIPQGKGYKVIAKELQNELHTSFNNAFRLVRTESAHVQAQVNKDLYMQAYNEGIATHYEFDAVDDERTSEICSSLNGKPFPITEMEEGVNAPPMHPNCRSTTFML